MGRVAGNAAGIVFLSAFPYILSEALRGRWNYSVHPQDFY